MHISNEYNDMASTEFEKRKEEEYEMQLLGFHSRAVNTTLKNVVYEAIESTCNKLCQTLQDKYNCDEDESKELKENKKKLIQTYNERAIPHLKLIENIVKKYISIPKNVLLDEDKCQSVQYTVEEYELLEERLKTLQQRAKKATLLNAALKEELTMVDQLESYIARSNKMCDLLENFSMHQDNNSKVMDEALKHYKDLYKQLLTMQPETEKVKYNSLEDFKGKDHNFDNL